MYKKRRKVNGRKSRFELDTPSYYRDIKLQYKYGISLDRYDEMYIEQQGKCKICMKPGALNGRGRTGRLHVDHCHKTGNVRGLLCYACNGLLGLSGDSPEVLSRAITYVMMGK